MRGLDGDDEGGVRLMMLFHLKRTSTLTSSAGVAAAAADVLPTTAGALVAPAAGKAVSALEALWNPTLHGGREMRGKKEQQES